MAPNPRGMDDRNLPMATDAAVIVGSVPCGNGLDGGAVR